MSADPVELLRDIPLPKDPFDRYDGVVARRRAGDRRRYAVLSAALATVLVAGGVSALALRKPDTQDLASVLSATPTTAHITGSTVKDGTVVVKYDGDLDLADKRVDLTITLQGQRLRLITIGKDTWFNAPGSRGNQTKPWVHSRTGMATGFGAALDPTQLYERLRASGAMVTEDGQADVGGARTTRYRVTLPRSADRSLFESGTGELYVDSEGYARRLVETNGGQTTTAEFSDFGDAVQISPPPADQVQEQPDLSSFGGSTPSPPTSCSATSSEPLPTEAPGFGVQVRSQPFCLTFEGGPTSTLTAQQRQQLCAAFTQQYAPAVKAHPEQRAQLDLMKAQFCQH